MSDALLFTLIFAGLFVLRIILATIFFACILPAGDRCLMCDAPTIRVASRLDKLRCARAAGVSWSCRFVLQ